MIVLHPDQSHSIEATADSMRAGNKSVLLQGATGSGKSVMAAELVRRATLKGSRTWFIVPRRELLRQMTLTYEQFNLPHGFIAAGRPAYTGALTNICSTGTLIKRLSRYTPPNLAIIDETHVGGNGLNGIIKHLKAAGTYIIGLSATPVRLSGKGLGCWYDDMVTGPSIRKLITDKRLSDYRLFAPDRPDMSGVAVSGGDYAKEALSSRMENDRVLIGNAVNHYKQYAMGKLCVAYCVSIAHSKIVAAAFNAAGIPAAHIDGKTQDYERVRIIRAFANREILVLTSCELLTYGFDLASQVGRDVTVECMSDMRPTKSLALQMQKWGRVLRMKSQPALIFDHANNVIEHGFPCTERAWTLQDIPKGMKKAGEKALPVRQCEKCYYCHAPAPTCPNCGFRYPVESREIEEIEGELQELDPLQAIIQKREKKLQEWQCKTLDDWKALAKERGHKIGWAFMRFNLQQRRKRA